MSFLQKILFLITICTFISCQKEVTKIVITADDYHKAVAKLTEVMVHDIFSPPVASRVYVYPNIAAYEVLNSGDSNYKSLVNQVKGLVDFSSNDPKEKVDKKLAALIAYLEIAKELVFSKKTIETYRDSLFSVWKTKNEAVFLTAKKHASPFTSHILNWMNSDHYKETRTMPDFNISSDDPSRWEPTPPSYMKGIEPNWRALRPFVLESASEFKPTPPPKFSLDKKSPFFKELKYVYDLTNEIKEKGAVSEEIKIALFWDCNPFVTINKGHFMFASKKITPGAHWIGICKIAAQKTNSDFSKTVFAYTKTSIAIADGFISCWDEKYSSNLVRPETLINKFIDADWTPVLQTPPFPEYTSGHSVVSGAAAEVLTDIFGDNFSFEDTTELRFGLPTRSFSSFKNAAKEAAVSRIYGGIHYNAAIEEGLTQGIKIGEKINMKLLFQ
ncbi:MAG: hypothetical protein ACJA17_000771 [Polaribacter sp.]|jgi:hypothetical protein